jgi:hypothetical protein
MKKICLSLIAGFFLLMPLLMTAPAHAQATRTWVSGVGDDANPCSRTAPCKTFAGAISKTAAGGEISVLDPGGFGAVTITKSISIVNYDSGEAGILASGTNGVIVNGAGINVYLRGLVIDGGTPAVPGLNGIRFLSGASLYVDQCVIKNFTAANAFGINFLPSANAELFVADSTIINNGPAGSGGGILVAPTAAATVRTSITNTRISNNTSGFTQDGAATSGALRGTFYNSIASGNAATGISSVGGSGLNRIMFDHSSAANNSIGLSATNANGAVLSAYSSVSGNDTGLSVTASGKLFTYKNNSVNGNASDGAFTDTIVPE